MLDSLLALGYDVRTLHHAEAILTHDIPEAAEEIESVLREARIDVVSLIRGGGGEADFTQNLRMLFESMGWEKHSFEIKKIIDGKEKESISHEVDHVKRFDKGVVALEIEWNNKDPFFDRDLENFKRLHADGVISVGCIITRGESLHANIKDIVAEFAERNEIDSLDKLKEFYSPTARQKNLIIKSVQRLGSFARGWAHAFVSDKFGESTTHWGKLDARVRRGVGNPCPLLLIGIPDSIVYSST